MLLDIRNIHFLSIACTICTFALCWTDRLKNDFITLLFIKLYRFIIYFQDIYIRESNESFEIKKLTKMFSRGSSIVNPKLHYYIMAIPRKVATETIILNFLY